MDAPGYVPSSVGSTMGSVSHKILKTSHADVSTLQRNVSRSQHTSAANPSPYPVSKERKSSKWLVILHLLPSHADVSTLQRYVSPSHPASEANLSPYPVSKVRRKLEMNCNIASMYYPLLMFQHYRDTCLIGNLHQRLILLRIQ